MTEWVDKKSQARIDMGLSSSNEEQLLNKAIEAEAKRAEQKRRKRQKLLKSTPYALSEGVATLMDKYYLDVLIGLVPSVGDVLSSIFMIPQLYLALFEIRSIPLTLAVLLNIIIDACLGIIPFWIGNIIDIFNRAYIKNMRLINGFVNDDPEVIGEVNQKALISAVLIVVFIGIIYLLISAVEGLISWIGSWF